MGQLANTILAHGDGRDEALFVLLPILVVVPVALWRHRRKTPPPDNPGDTTGDQ